MLFAAAERRAFVRRLATKVAASGQSGLLCRLYRRPPCRRDAAPPGRDARATNGSERAGTRWQPASEAQPSERAGTRFPQGLERASDQREREGRRPAPSSAPSRRLPRAAARKRPFP
jgi:hypothetical protein